MLRRYRSCRTPQEFDAGYANYIDAAVVAKWEAWFRARSAAVLSSSLKRVELAYGSHVRQRMDFFPASRDAETAPTVLAIHGGLWALFDRWMMHFLAPCFTSRGINLVCTSYRLAPEASLSEIVHDCRDALACLEANAATLQLDASEISVLGHSAAGQLAAVLASGSSAVRALVGVSGFYDIEPFEQTNFQPMVRFGTEDYRRWNPMELGRPGMAPALLITGAEESAWLHEMSTEYARTLRTMGNPVELLDAPRECHFSVLATVADPDSLAHQAVMRAVHPRRLSGNYPDMMSV